jgi:LysR family glycine cleavage system transcriptional activator
MAGRPPSLRAISAFEAAARYGSFAKAAAELHLTQGAISHAVRTLENRLGTCLFDRQSRGVVLTEAGRLLAGRVRLSIALLSDAFETRPWLERSRLVVSALPALASRVLVPRLKRFYDQHPNIEVEVRSNWALTPIGEGEIDIGLRYGPGGWVGLSAVKLADEMLCPVVGSAYDKPFPSTPGDLIEHQLICHPEFPWEVWFAAAGLRPFEAVRSVTLDDSILVLEAAIAGMGIALGRSFLTQCDILNGRLVRLFDIEIRSQYSYWMVWNPVSPKLPTIDLFRTWLAEELADYLAKPCAA